MIESVISITNILMYAIMMVRIVVRRIKLGMVFVIITTIFFLVATMTEETAMNKTNGLIVKTPI